MKTWIGLIIPDENLTKTVHTLIKVNSDAQVVGTWNSVAEAIPDLKTKGEVPVILGIGTGNGGVLRDLKTLQLSGPHPIIGVGPVVEASPLLFDAFRLGMIDFVPFSQEEIANPTDSLLKEISRSIEIVSLSNASLLTRARLKSFKESEKIPLEEDQVSYYTILGVPRGGVTSAIKLLTQLPRRKDCALIISLPIPHVGVGPFVADLNKYTQWSVLAGSEGQKIFGGGCYLLSSYDPFSVEGSIDGKCRIVSRTQNSQPIDTLMENLAGSFGESVMGVLLEGAGDDGIAGLSAIRARGGTTFTIKAKRSVLTQSAEEAFREGAVDLLMDSEDLPKFMSSIMGEMYDITNINRLIIAE